MVKKIIKILKFGIPILLICTLFINLIIPHYETKDGLCVLGYHGVVSDEEKKLKYANYRYALSIIQFEEQMKYLYENGYTTYSMEDVLLYKQGKLEIPEKAVVLTFDDGLKNFNDVVKPILEKYKFKGTCFVIGKHLEDTNNKYLKLEDINNTEYVSYYSHSYDLHRKSKQGFDRKIIQDLSFDEISNDFEKNLVDNTFFAFPYGRSVEGIENTLKENNVQLAFGYNQFRHMTLLDDNYYLPRYMIVDLMPISYFKWIVE